MARLSRYTMSNLSCALEGCDRPAKVKMLCDGHYQQQIAGKELTTLQVTVRGGRGCDHPGCARPHERRGFCKPHARRYVAGKPMHLRSDPNQIEVDDAGTWMLLYDRKGAVIARTQIDLEVVPRLSGRWSKNVYGYVRQSRGGPLLHRLLLNASEGIQVDHINGDTLDNRQENLRLVTYEQNMQNKKSWAQSGHRNIYWEHGKQRWRVIVTLDGVKHSGGRHKELDDAIEAARSLRERLFTHSNEDRH